VLATRVLLFSWGQLLLDFVCLSALSVLTGGAQSPLRGFFVFHMVIASLLLPRVMAYGAAAVAVLMLGAALYVSGQFPDARREGMLLGGLTVMLFGTVWLANGIVRGLRRQRRRLARQNRRIRRLARALRKQQHAMVQQEKMAVAGRMAAGVAHEIANPLASMDGLLQMMERRPEKLKPESVSTLREQIGRINRIVRQMTAFARPGDGGREPVDLSMLAGKALDVVRFDPRTKGVKVETEFAIGLPPVRVAPDAIQQVIINLVINALDAMEGGEGAVLTMKTGRDAERVFVEVADNGQGISPAHRKHLFEPFFTTKPVGKGTGLGLSISYSLVREHGGEIVVESEEAKGARFRVTLPVG
jgi:signal transduction histidine kinase